MAVVQIGIMRVLVDERHMAVAMRMRMPVMLVMGVAVLVLERIVHVFVLVRLGEMQVEPNRHQKTRKNELQRHGFTKQGDRDNGADKWRRREIGAGARGAEMTQSEHEQDEADAIADKADDRRAADRRRGGLPRRRQGL